MSKKNLRSNRGMKVIYNDKFLNAISWFMQVGGITLFPFIVLRESLQKTSVKSLRILRHEKTHIEQQKELLVVVFYLWYFIEWLIRLFMKGDAYRNISFEREAYSNQDNTEYLKTRKLYSFLKYI